MRRTTRRRKERPRAEINITNLIDVTLTLLIVFMIVAPLLKQGLEIDLPESRFVKGVETNDKVILVEYDKNGTVHVNRMEVLPGAVEETIRELRDKLGDLPVHLRADKTLPYGDVVGIYGEILSAGVKTVDVETEPISIED